MRMGPKGQTQSQEDIATVVKSTLKITRSNGGRLFYDVLYKLNSVSHCFVQTYAERGYCFEKANKKT